MYTIPTNTSNTFLSYYKIICTMAFALNKNKGRKGLHSFLRECKPCFLLVTSHTNTKAITHTVADFENVSKPHGLDTVTKEKNIIKL